MPTVDQAVDEMPRETMSVRREHSDCAATWLMLVKLVVAASFGVRNADQWVRFLP